MITNKIIVILLFIIITINMLARLLHIQSWLMVGIVIIITKIIIIITIVIIIIITRPKPNYGQQGLAGGSLCASGSQLGRGK